MADDKAKGQSSPKDIIWATPHASRGLTKSASDAGLSNSKDWPAETEDSAGGATLEALSPGERVTKDKPASDSGAVSRGHAKDFMGLPEVINDVFTDPATAAIDPPAGFCQSNTNVRTHRDNGYQNIGNPDPNNGYQTTGQRNRYHTPGQRNRYHTTDHRNSGYQTTGHRSLELVQTPAFDAQLHYPRDAAIFVANLPMDKSNIELEREVLNKFMHFGTVFVSVRRRRDLPFAFVQYTRREDALDALEHGAGTAIGGRPCRIERVLGDTIFIISRRVRGLPFTTDEARELMGPLGDIADAQYVDHTHTSVRVTYRYRDSRRQPLKAFADDPDWVVIREYINETTKTGLELPSDDWQVRYNRQTCTAWFGKMPHTFNEAYLRSLASEVGNVVHIDFRPSRPLPDGSPSTAFAFVEFERPDQVDAAVARFHGTVYDDRRLKVERRRAPNEATPRRPYHNFQTYHRFDQQEYSPAPSSGVFSSPSHPSESTTVVRTEQPSVTPVRSTAASRHTRNSSSRGNHGPTHSRGSSHGNWPYRSQGVSALRGGRQGQQPRFQPNNHGQVASQSDFNFMDHTPSRVRQPAPQPNPPAPQLQQSPAPPPAFNVYQATSIMPQVPPPQRESMPYDAAPVYSANPGFMYQGPPPPQYPPYFSPAPMPPMVPAM